MAEFLIFADNNFPVDGDSKERTQHIRAAERERAGELRAAGNLKRLWRRPGSTAGLRSGRPPTRLSSMTSSPHSPMFPYLEITVEPLATHPQER